MQERVQQAEKASLCEQLRSLQTDVADKQASLQALQTAHMHAQVATFCSVAVIHRPAEC